MKKIKQSVIVIIFLAVVHTLLCVGYNYTYFSAEFNFQEKFQGVLYWVMLMVSFLAGPFFYYITGRFCKNKGNKKAVISIILTLNVAAAIFGIVSLFITDLSEIYRLINAPSYLYFSLFSETVMYIAVPAMLVTALFPVLFFRMGYFKKPRTNNEIKMEDIEIKDKKEL